MIPSARGWLLLLSAWLLLAVGCQPRTLLSDSFDANNPDRWWHEADAIGRSAITNGRLVIEIDQPDTMQFATLRQPLVRDFSAQVEATVLAGSLHSSHGILFRKQESGGFYRFNITPSGNYMIEKRSPDGGWERYTPTGGWEFSPHIITGLGATNRLKVAVKGNNAVFSVNGQVVQRIDSFDQSYSTGTIALDAGTFVHAGLQVAFDNFLLQEQ
jgi:hypothetical protein